MPASNKVLDEAFVTLATSDNYALGALVLSSSLRRIQTDRQLVVMVTPGVTQTMRDQLLYAFDAVVNVDILDSRDATNLEILGRPDLGQTFTKLHCWRLTQYTKCVFMDADTLVLKNIDDLFDREELSAAPDVGWPDCFNSGVFVFRPSEETYRKLLQFAVTHGSFDGGDQGLLNQFFSDWASKDISKHLPFIYNVVGHSFYSYLPAFFQFGQATKVAHFIGAIKPWHLGYNRATNNVESGDMRHIADFVHIWWRIFMEDVHHRLLGNLPCLVNVFERYPPPPPPPVNHAPPPPPPPEPVNYQMSAPYVPPNIPVYYEQPPQHHQPPQPAPAPQQYIEPPDSRPYTHMESFYSEPPMTHTDSYTRPDVAYQAKDVCHSWTEFSHAPPPEEHRDEPGGPEPAHAPEPAPEPAHVESHPLPAVVEEPEQPVEVPVQEAEPPSNLETFTKDKMEDHQHQLNWEHGQIDYLGVDSFDNILAQINSVITAQAAAPRRSASDGNVRPLKSPTKGKPRRPASVIDTSSDGTVEPDIEVAQVRPLESSAGGIKTVGLERVLGGVEPDVQSEREEILVRRPGRKQQLVTGAELELQEPALDRLLAKVTSKPVSPRKATDTVPAADRVERVIRAGGRRQEIIGDAELEELKKKPATNGSVSPPKLQQKPAVAVAAVEKQTSGSDIAGKPGKLVTKETTSSKVSLSYSAVASEEIPGTKVDVAISSEAGRSSVRVEPSGATSETSSTSRVQLAQTSVIPSAQASAPVATSDGKAVTSEKKSGGKHGGGHGRSRKK